MFTYQKSSSSLLLLVHYYVSLHPSLESHPCACAQYKKNGGPLLKTLLPLLMVKEKKQLGPRMLSQECIKPC